MPITVISSIGSRTSDNVTIDSVASASVTGYANAWTVTLSASVPSTTKVGDKLTRSAVDYLILAKSGADLTVSSNPFGHTTAPTTGAATTARAYSTIGAWFSASPSNLTTQGVDGWIWKGELYAEGGGTNGEWSSASQVGFDSGSKTTSETCYCWLAAAPGASFGDHASKASNALRYNNANGVAIRCTSTSTSDHAMWIANGASWRFTGLQVRADGGNVLHRWDGPAMLRVENCIFYAANDSSYTFYGRGGPTTGNPVLFLNSVLYATKKVVRPFAEYYAVRNCTVVSTNGGAYLFDADVDGMAKNSAFFGATAYAPGTAYWVSSNNNATDLASLFGSSNQTSLTGSAQFESLTGGSEDFRAKASGALDENGTRDQTYTGDLDIVGQARSTSTPTIGAWEVASGGGGGSVARLAHHYRQLGVM